MRRCLLLLPFAVLLLLSLSVSAQETTPDPSLPTPGEPPTVEPTITPPRILQKLR